ncbi:hypothetical protein BDW66DRAFT_145285, partial [Aspergillus desertorum]
MFGALGANIALSVLAAGAMVFCPVPLYFGITDRAFAKGVSLRSNSLRVYEETTVEREYYAMEMIVARRRWS